MVRPIKQDRESIALTHVRISFKTKALLDKVKLEGNFRTHDQALLSLLLLLSPTKPSKALTVTDLLQRPDVNKLLTSVSNDIYHNHVKPRPRQTSSRPKPKKQSSFSKSSYKF